MPILDGIEATMILRKMMNQKELDWKPIVMVSAGNNTELSVYHDNTKISDLADDLIEKPLQIVQIEKIL